MKVITQNKYMIGATILLCLSFYLINTISNVNSNVEFRNNLVINK